MIRICDSLVQDGFNLTLSKLKIDTSYAFVGLVPETVIHHGREHIPYSPKCSVLSGSKGRSRAIFSFCLLVLGYRITLDI
jgi:hypothetical protein